MRSTSDRRRRGSPVDYRFLDINRPSDDARIEPFRGCRKDLSDVVPVWGGSGSIDTPGPTTALRRDFEIWHEPQNKWFDVHAFSPEPGQVVALVLDITAQRAASTILLRSLEEKSALLKELHHRVKNNLQILSSLINLHSSVLQNPTERDLLKNYQRRIRSIALVHETMYQAADLSHVDFGEYLHTVVSELQWSLHIPSVEYRVVAGFHPADLSSAIPCGMIVTELVTNALTHAFKGRERGVLSVHAPRKQGCTEILITDDGVGFVVPEHRRMGTTVGLFLVDVLMEQLGGTFEITSGSGGTRCRVLAPSAG